MWPTWGPSGANRTQVGPMLAPWTLLSGITAVTYWGRIWIRVWTHKRHPIPRLMGVGGGWGLRWWSTMWVGPLISSSTSTGDVWIFPSSQIWGYMLYVEYISCVVTHESWPTSVSHSFSSLNSSLGLAGGKHYYKTIIHMFRLLQNLAIPSCFPCILFYNCLFSLHSSGWFVIAVCLSFSSWN